MPLVSLPIDDAIPQIVAALRTADSVVLRAPTGAGKTTRVPPAILDSGLAPGEIVVLQPRRVAARATAVRMASERGSEIGQEIGYHTRFDRKSSRNTRILCMTEGILLRRLLADPFLEGVSAVVFDEFHERNLASDLALGMVRQVQQSVRAELKIAVMSATLDPTPIAAYLGNCPMVESQGRTFEVTIEHTSALDRLNLDDGVCESVREVLSRTDGDILVFLPGVGEIRKIARRLHGLSEQGIAVLELYGDLSPEKQDAVLERSPRRKVILATNVAETSLTIEGVTGVVDSGLARVSRFDEQTGLDRLELSPISQASAQQRAGRAGRTAPGICLRLWPEAAHRARPERETPEIQRVDLSSTLLQLGCWIEPDFAKFPWFEPPRPTSLDHAQHLLARLEAFAEGRITPLGREMARLPIHPRLGRMLIEGSRLGCVERVALGAALLSERSSFASHSANQPRRTRSHTSASDLLDRIAALEAFEQRGSLQSDAGLLLRSSAQSVLRVRDQLLRLAQRSEQSAGCDADDTVLKAVLAGFPDRVAKRREIAGHRAVMVGGRGVRIADTSAVDQAELFVCLDVDGSQGDALVRQASAVRREWLPEHLLAIRVEVAFDTQKQQLAARRRVYWDDLLLEESPAALPNDESTTQALVSAGEANWEQAFPSDNAPLMGFIHRVRFLAEAMPEFDMSTLDDPAIRRLLPILCMGRRSLAELRRAPWLEQLRALFSYQQLQTLDREAPERVLVPSGNRIALEYEPGKRPVLAVRIQELFGLAETPRIAGGRVPILLHLLAPNMRPQQITDDLKSFWNNTYPQVRKDLRGRYPKHSWPEDPWNAQPQTRPRRS